MTWIAGTSRAGYDHVGVWTRVVDAGHEHPEAFAGDVALLGDWAPGTDPSEGPVRVRFSVGVEL